MNSASHYDVAIIGAGMSGLAAGIRLAHFGRRVCIFERHNAPGGLNSFYSLAGRKFDVGLHALTNFVRPGAKGTPLVKILRQLRIDREEFDLSEQRGSRVAFGPRGEHSLRFTNDPAMLASDIAEKFPREIDGWRSLLAALPGYDAIAAETNPASAREFAACFLRDQLQLDSMDFLDIVMELRKRYGIEVPEADYMQLASLDSCAEYLTPKFNALATKG